MEVIRGLANPIHPVQILILSWTTKEEALRESSNSKIPLREYVLKQRYSRLDPKQINSPVVAYRAGSIIKEPAAQFRIHHRTVSNVFERHRVPRRNRPLTPEHIEHTIRTNLAGSSSKVIDNLLGVDESTILRTLRREGIVMRDSHGRKR